MDLPQKNKFKELEIMKIAESTYPTAEPKSIKINQSGLVESDVLKKKKL